MFAEEIYAFVVETGAGEGKVGFLVAEVQSNPPADAVVDNVDCCIPGRLGCIGVIVLGLFILLRERPPIPSPPKAAFELFVDCIPGRVG